MDPCGVGYQEPRKNSHKRYPNGIIPAHQRKCQKEDIYIDFINGHLDHVHCPLTLNTDMTISKALQLIKGEASFWANQNKIIKPKLDWADEYFAVSISESQVDIVRNYIKNQEEHHKKVTFA